MPSKLPPTGFTAEQLSRPFDALAWHIKESTGFDFIQEIQNRCRTILRPISILDIGCGTGVTLEQLAHNVYPNLGKSFSFIGIDTNADLMKDNSLKRIHVVNNQTAFNPWSLTDFHVDDATTLSTIPDNSIDIAYSSNTLMFVENKLAALEAGYRVLRKPRANKPGGVAVWHVAEPFSKPSLQQILEVTPGANKVFTYSSYCKPVEGISYGYLVCRKSMNNEFKGFPYEFKGFYLFEPDAADPALRQMVVSKYKKKGGWLSNLLG